MPENGRTQEEPSIVVQEEIINITPRAGAAQNPYLIPASILIGAVIIGAFILIGFSQGGAGNPAAAAGAAAAAQKVDIKDVNIAGDPYIGEASAPVTLAYWSDYQCPFCKAFEVGGVEGINGPAVMPTLIKNYVDKGKLKIVFKDFAFLSEDSDTAALWGRAMWDLYPGKYWQWREAMYHAQDEEHGGFGDEASILALTKKISGVDASAVKARVAAKRDVYKQAIDADKEEGQGFGIGGTPGFITGKTLIGGFAALSKFTDAIDAQL